jgi:hypothetical protein
VRVAFRHFLLDSESTQYRLPSAALDRMLHNPPRHRLARFAGQRVRSAEVVVEMMNGRPLAVLRSVFNMLTFKSDGTLVSPLRDRLGVRCGPGRPLARVFIGEHANNTSRRGVARSLGVTCSTRMRQNVQDISGGPQRSMPCSVV